MSDGFNLHVHIVLVQDFLCMSNGTTQVCFTLGYIVWRPGPRNGGFFHAFFDAMALSVDAVDGAVRHRNLRPDALPRISYALPWPAVRPRVQMSLK